MTQWLTVAATAFILVAPVELPDKTFVATLVLSTRYRPLPVWLGVVAAFGVQCLFAVLAGHLISRLPERPVQLVAAGLFAVGAVVLLRGARGADAAEVQQEREYEEIASERSSEASDAAGVEARDVKQGWHAAVASFAVLFTAEWGDLSQLLTASLVASGRPGVPVFVGSWAALAAVSGAAVLLGRWLLRHVRLSVVRYVAAGVCAVLAVVTVLGVS